MQGKPTTTIQVQQRREYDPTHTTTLRNRFAGEMGRRFRSLAQLIRTAVDEEDVFGLRERRPGVLQTPGRRAFEFTTDAGKLRAFNAWLQREVDREIFGFRPIPGTSGTRWTDRYITSAYQQGIRRAIVESRRIRGDSPDFDLPNATAVAAEFNSPVHYSRVSVLWERVWTDLAGVTAAMSADMDRVLAQGFIEGRNPRVIARSLNKVITGKGGDLSLVDSLGRRISSLRRAQLIARTEIIRAHHLGNIQELRRFQVPGVVLRAEWSTAGDHRVCPQCQDLEGRVFTLDQIEGMIPLHPLCRCVAIPVRIPTRRAA